MDWRSRARTTKAALKNWFIAQCQDSLAVALLWLAGLWIIGIPWAPLWAFLAGLLQFIPKLRCGDRGGPAGADRRAELGPHALYLCPDPVRCDHGRGRVPAPAVFHASDGQNSVLGSAVYPYSRCVADSILVGDPAGPAATGGVLCVQEKGSRRTQ